MSDIEHINNLYYLTLTRRADNIFYISEEVGLHGIDLPLVTELKDFIAKNYYEIRGIIEIFGRIYEGQVFAPRIEEDHFYTIVDESGIPVFATTADVAPSEAQLDTINDAARALEYSEALSPYESIFISDSFIEPEFEEVSDSGRTLRHISWAALREMARVIVVGVPGAGKTTALRRLGLEHWDRSQSLNDHPFPIYVQMRHFREGAGVEQVVRTNLLQQHGKYTTNCSADINLSNRRVVLILDGLDEVPEDFRDLLIDAISSFALKNPTLSIVASTREAGYRWQLPSFRYVRILPFTIAKIREWSYYRLQPDMATPWRSFIANLEERPELRELASNPLLLSLAISLYRRNSCLPQNRAALLKSYFDAVTEQWDSVRGVVRQRESWATPARKVAALCRTAYGIRSSGQEFFTEAEFSEWNAGFGVNEALLPVCQRDTGVVTQQQATGRWCFAHGTFADYLTARYVVEHTGDAGESLGKIFKTGDWLDIWAYSCGLAQDATTLVFIVLASRQITRSKKLDALSVAFAQDVIVSSDATKATLSFIKAEIQRVFLRTRALASIEKNQVAESDKIRFRVRDSVSGTKTLADTEVLLRALQRLRDSLLGRQIRSWLYASTNKILQQLASMLSRKGALSLSVKNSTRGGEITMEPIDDLPAIRSK